MYNIKKLNRWLRTVGDATGLAHGHRQQTAMAPWGHNQSNLWAARPASKVVLWEGRRIRDSGLYGTFLSSKSNREESNMYTDLCHLSPMVKVNLAFPPQS